MHAIHCKKGPFLCLNFATSTTSVEKVTLSISDHFHAHVDERASTSLIQTIEQWMICYSELKEAPLPALDLKHLTPFQTKVLLTLGETKIGQTLSYKELATLANYAKAYRAVGTICRLNPFSLLIPCHRVITHKGTIGNYAYGIDMKSQLLKFEKALK